MIETIVIFSVLLLIAILLEPLSGRFKLPFSSLLVVVGFVGSEIIVLAGFDTGLRWDDFVGIITRLHHMGYKIVVLYVADDSCPLLPEGVLLYEIGAHFESMEQRGEFVSR